MLGSLSLITFNGYGAGDSSIDINTIVKEKIKFFLQTNKGEIVANPSYGADLIHFVMRPIDNTMSRQLLNVIKTEMAQQMPYIVIKRLEGLSNPTQGTLYFNLHYSINNVDDSVGIGV